MDSKEWFEIIYYKKDLIIIREKLSEIDPRYHTEYSNIFLINGSIKSMLIDTGSGLFPLKSIIENLIDGRDLIVINTHSHFDHIGSNNEFDEVYIHEKELNKINKSIDISFLKDSPKEIVTKYKNIDFTLKPAKRINTIKEGDIFDLGEIQVKTVHCAGHSEGSLSLYTDRGELFTGDSAHYGAMYLPSLDNLSIFIKMIQKLIRFCNENNLNQLFPSHEIYFTNKDLLIELIDSLNKIKALWKFKNRDDFNNSWVIDTDKFKFMVKMD
ncbi:MAG: MBL fold metallo-hydrolase [Candidatus Lokiarchaeota archaeon]|nr:MBL fold metallo-hydrolase [Candidatus Lokiarchaeota archaeon]